MKDAAVKILDGEPDSFELCNSAGKWPPIESASSFCLVRSAAERASLPEYSLAEVSLAMAPLAMDAAACGWYRYVVSSAGEAFIDSWPAPAKEEVEELELWRRLSALDLA